MLKTHFEVQPPYGEPSRPATTRDFQDLGKVWPVEMPSAELLGRLDNCARKAHIRARFSAQTDLLSIRSMLADCLSQRGFQAKFIAEFGEIIPAMFQDLSRRNALDILPGFVAINIVKASPSAHS